MNREDIIRLAREAGLPLNWISESGVLTWSELERFAALVATHVREQCARLYENEFIFDSEEFAALVAAHEREACARLCEETTASWSQHVYNEACIDCAKAIRARGEK